VKIRAAGVNYIDVYQRNGAYAVPLPFVMGLEGSGTVERTGPGVAGFREGDRVAYEGIPHSYAEYACVPADRAVKLPEGVDFRQGAAAMLQGMTAHYLTHTVYPLGRGDSCLVHAAAGGVGLLLVQMAKMLGARVYGTVSTEEKAGLAKEAGADEVIIYTRRDFEKEIKSLTGGGGVNAIYDSVGKTTFEKGFRCLARRGFMVLFGQSSGHVGAFDPAVLAAGGSLTLVRPSLKDYTVDRASLENRANDVLGWVASGRLTLRIRHVFGLSEAAEAHRSLEGRKTTGKVILIP
jgi:NADPH2:quinone reductase